MSEAQHLAAALERLFSEPRLSAFLPFIAATDGLTAAQAAAVPAPRFNSVWAIVNHVWFWEANLLRLLQGREADHRTLGAPDKSGWPPIGEDHGEADWQLARQRALETNAALAREVERLTDDELAQPLPAWGGAKHRSVQGIIAHNSYHTCEIISVRHMQGLWLEGA